MISKNYSTSPTPDRPFATTANKYNEESKSGKLTSTNFPYDEIQSLPGYKGRLTPGLSRSDVARELSRYLAEYAEKNGRPLRHSQRDITGYLFIQAERGMLKWGRILAVVRAARKQDQEKPIAHYLGYPELIETKGKARYDTLIKLVRYVYQEGQCFECKKEFPFDKITLDHVVPRSAKGPTELTNMQLMCKPCNGRKGAS